MICPQKLKQGDEIRIIAPARSLSLLSEENIALAKGALEKEGFHVSFSKYCRESDVLHSSSVKSRVEDIHEAFRDPHVKAILTVIGGFNSNQLLQYLDYELIGRNPKILCGYSDITALANAITAKTDVVTYSGPHFSTWSMKKGFEYNLEYFKKCLLSEDDFVIEPSQTWSDDEWYKNQEQRVFEQNEGYVVLRQGVAEGKVLGGNLGTFNLLFGTEYMPDISGSVLFLEECFSGEQRFVEEFDRNLQSLIQQPGFSSVRGIVFGRFQKQGGMTMEMLRYVVDSKKELYGIPIVANADFGHTNPMYTFPIGGQVRLSAGASLELKILKH